MSEEVTIRAVQRPFRSGVELAIAAERNGKMYVMDNVSFVEAADGVMINPDFTLSPNDAQQLIDDLWQAGLRPTEGTGSAGSLSATQNHLKDMRKISGKFLELEL